MEKIFSIKSALVAALAVTGLCVAAPASAQESYVPEHLYLYGPAGNFTDSWEINESVEMEKVPGENIFCSTFYLNIGQLRFLDSNRSWEEVPWQYGPVGDYEFPTPCLAPVKFSSKHELYGDPGCWWNNQVGTYTLTMNFDNSTFFAEFVCPDEIYVVGGAVGSWDPDKGVLIEATLDDPYVFKGTVELKSGEDSAFRFYTLNSNWLCWQYGPNANDAMNIADCGVTQNISAGWAGNNMQSFYVSEDAAGTYDITLDFNEGTILAVREGTAVNTVGADTDSDSSTVYGIDGSVVLRNASAADIKSLPQGLYIRNGRKIVNR